MSNRSTPLNAPLRSAGHAIRAMQDLERQASANRRLAWERAGRPKPPPTPKKRYGHSGEVRACAARLRQENERLRELGPAALGGSLRAVTALPAALAHASTAVAATPSAAPPPPATPPSASLAALPASRPPPPPAEPAVVRRHSADFLDPKGPGTPPKARPGLTSKTSSWTPLPGGAPPTPDEPAEVPLFFGDLGAQLVACGLHGLVHGLGGVPRDVAFDIVHHLVEVGKGNGHAHQAGTAPHVQVRPSTSSMASPCRVRTSAPIVTVAPSTGSATSDTRMDRLFVLWIIR